MSTEQHLGPSVAKFDETFKYRYGDYGFFSLKN